MNESLLPATSEQTRAAVSALFENTPPVLVEVRFPGAATSPDWYLFEEEEQLDQLLEGLGPAVELHVSSVWDLHDDKGEICLKK